MYHVSQDCGWKGWGEISYGGSGCVKRAKATEFLVAKLTKGMFGDYFLFFCFLKLVFECFENCNKKQYYNSFENKKFVW